MFGFRRHAIVILAAALVGCAQDIVPSTGADLTGQWVFNQSLILGPEDGCYAHGYFVLTQTSTSLTGTVTAQGAVAGSACAVQPTGAIQNGMAADSSVSFNYPPCLYYGTVHGATADSLAGTFTCTTLNGTGNWSAARLGPATALALTNWPSHSRIVVGGSVVLGAVLKDAAGHPLFGLPITWSSDNPAVATVSAPNPVDSTITATGAGVGSATVTASSNGFSASAHFTVSQVQFASVSAGWNSSCGVALTGDTWCWGWPVGDGTYYPSNTPVQVSGGLALSSVSVGGGGGGAACGVAAGTVYCWNTPAPVAVPLAFGFTSVSVGGSHSCGLKTGGAGFCWGYDLNGELGNGSTAPEQCSGYPCSTTPVQVAGLLTFAAVSAGAVHSCGLTAAGAAWCWGSNLDGGQLGDSSTTNRNSPVAVKGGLTFSSVSAGGNHTCGVATGGAAWCWGLNLYGELGNGSVTGPQQCSGYNCSITPVAVSGGLTFSSVSAGEQHSCGVTTAGKAYCWGLNIHGQLGDGTSNDSSSPVAVSGGLTFVSVSASLGNQEHSCGLTTAGVVYCWGYNYSGQLGNGSNVISNVPVRVTGQP